MTENLKSICSYLELLVKNQSCDKDLNIKVTKLELELKARVEKLFQKVQLDEDLYQKIQNLSPALLTSTMSDAQFEIRWTFIEWCLVFLILLKETLDCLSRDQKNHHHSNAKNQPIPQPNMLSISQEKTVLATVQFVVALGIFPSLLKGVGIPLYKRCQQYTVFQELQSNISPQQTHRRLVACTVVILNCIDQTELRSIILTAHFIDLLSSLCQLCYAPIKKTSSAVVLKNSQSIREESLGNKMETIENNENCPTVSELLRRVRDSVELSEEQIIKEMWEDRIYLTSELEKLIKRSYKPLLVSTLIQLQKSIPCRQTGKFDTVRTPMWMCKACGMLLTKELIQPNGVFTIIQGILILAGTEDERESLEKWKRYEAMGKIIAQVPSNSPSAEMYYKSISSQILSLLQTKEVECNRLALWIIICTIFSMSEHKPTLTEKYIFNSLLKPLKCCLITSDYHLSSETDGTVLSSEKELTLCIENLHKIALCSTNLPSQILNKLISVFIPLFHLFSFITEGVFHLRQKIEDIVAVVLKTSNESAQLLLGALFNMSVSEGCQAMRTDVSFEYGEDACVKIVKKCSRFNSEDTIAENFKKCSCGIFLLQNLKDRKLIGKMFFSLLQELQEALKDSKIIDGDEESQNSVLEFVTEDNQDLRLAKLNKNLLMLQLIQEVSEQFGDVITEDSDQAIEFVQTTLDRCACFCKAEDTILGKETISLVLGALAMLVAQKDKLKSDDWRKMNKCIPSLQNIALNFQGSIKTTAHELMTIIATHGAAGWNKLGQEYSKHEYANAQQKGYNSCTTDKSTRCNIKSDTGADSTCTSTHQNISDYHQNFTQNNLDIKKVSSYQTAMNELNDILLPVRGHALIELKKLILSRDSETLRNSDKLIKIFTELLFDTDSYIYLSAIQCLSALGTIYADKVIPALSEQFSQSGKPNDLRIKIAEALMHIIRTLGDLSPKYRDTLLPIFLCGTKDEDAQIRVSSLSNLGEICQRLKFALGPYLQEVLLCVQSCLKTDSSVEVRRSAALTLSLLLRGLGNDMLKILEEEMQNLYRLLRLCYERESDDVTKLHIQIALEEINIVTKEALFSYKPLIKEIKVLHS